MSLVRTLRHGIRRLVRPSTAERELDDELRDYLERSTRAHLMSGASLDEAVRAARREIGSIEAAKEEVRSSFWEASVAACARDLAYGARLLRRTPVFTAVVVLTLALGLGATAAFFSVADEVLWKRLPVAHPEQLVLLRWTSGPRGTVAASIAGVTMNPVTGEGTSGAFSRHAFERFRAETRTMTDVLAFADQVRAFSADRRAIEANGQLVSGNYFSTLGVTPRLGRLILADDDRVGAEAVAVISHRYWQRRFGGDPAAIGQTIQFDTMQARIIGVTPAGFVGIAQLGDAPDFVVPLGLAPRLGRSGSKFMGQLDRPYIWALRLMGRAKPGVTPDEVRAELQGAFQAIAIESWRAIPRKSGAPADREMPDARLDVISGSQGLTESRHSLTRSVALLAAIAALLLLIVCVNLTNLFLARAESRRREMAVRLALGARRGRLIRQLLTETLLMTAAGAALGVCCAYWGKDLLLMWIVRMRPQFVVEPSLDLRVLAFTAGVALLAALLIGFGPAWRATRTDPHPSLQEGGGHTLVSGWRGTRRDSVAGPALLVAQVALSLGLLVIAGLFVRTLRELQTADVGFRAENLLLFDVGRPNAGPAAQGSPQAFARFAAALPSLPGVQSVAYANQALLGGEAAMPYLSVPGLPKAPDEDRTVFYTGVSLDYFATMEMPIVVGRTFAPPDVDRSVVIVNETLARRFLGPNPIGRRIAVTKNPLVPEPAAKELVEVVGVVGDAKYMTVREAPLPTVFVSGMRPGQGSVAVRAAVPPMSLVPAIRAAAAAIGPELRVTDFRTQEEQAALTFAKERHFALLSSAFGAVALVLTSIGLYGLLSFRVARRTQEIGLRIALGAQRGHVVRSVLKDTLLLVVVGVLIGLGGAYAGAGFVRSMLYGIGAHDPIALMGAVALMLIVAVLAALVPARRAARVDPLIALRCE